MGRSALNLTCLIYSCTISHPQANYFCLVSCHQSFHTTPIHINPLQSRFLLERIDKPACARIVRVGLAALVQLSKNLLRQGLAQLNTPLVEAVDVPDGALGEGEVLVVDDQSTQGSRRDLLCEDGGGGAVAQEGLVGDELVGRALGLDFVGRLADHEGLSLGEEVGGKHPDIISLVQSQLCSHLLLVRVVLAGVVALCRQDEVGRDQLGALVEQLVEGVLGVGGGLAEEDGAGGVLDVVAAAGDGLSVRLHRQLLEVGREAVEVLVEAGPGQQTYIEVVSDLRRDEMCLGAEEVGVPDAKKTTNDGDVLLERSLLEMLVHGVRTGKQLVEVVKANVQSNAQTNSTPDTVAPSNPVGESEHVLLVDTELGDLLLVGRQSNEVLRNVLLLGALQEPCLCSVGVGDGLGGCEGLGSDEEEGGLGVRLVERLLDVCAVNIGDEVDLEGAVGVGLEGLRDHDGAAVCCQQSWSNCL